MSETREIQQLVERLSEVLHTIYRRTKEEMPPDDLKTLNVNQLRTLVLISREPGINQKDLAEYLRITPPSVSVSIRQLVELNLVQRTPDPDDGRIMRLTLGERGQQFAQIFQCNQQQFLAQLLTVLSPEQRISLVEILEYGIHEFMKVYEGES